MSTNKVCQANVLQGIKQDQKMLSCFITVGRILEWLNVSKLLYLVIYLFSKIARQAEKKVVWLSMHLVNKLVFS